MVFTSHFYCRSLKFFTAEHQTAPYINAPSLSINMWLVQIMSYFYVVIGNNYEILEGCIWKEAVVLNLCKEADKTMKKNFKCFYLQNRKLYVFQRKNRTEKFYLTKKRKSPGMKKRNPCQIRIPWLDWLINYRI